MVFLTGAAVFRSPEQRAEKGQAADIDTADVAYFVWSPGIVRPEYIHILAKEQAWQRERHQCPVQHAVAEAKGFIFGKSQGRSPSVKPAQQQGADQKSDNFYEPHLPSRNGDWCRI